MSPAGPPPMIKQSKYEFMVRPATSDNSHRSTIRLIKRSNKAGAKPNEP
jgi:hypothetical protein